MAAFVSQVFEIPIGDATVSFLITDPYQAADLGIKLLELKHLARANR